MYILVSVWSLHKTMQFTSNKDNLTIFNILHLGITVVCTCKKETLNSSIKDPDIDTFLLLHNDFYVVLTFPFSMSFSISRN